MLFITMDSNVQACNLQNIEQATLQTVMTCQDHFAMVLGANCTGRVWQLWLHTRVQSYSGETERRICTTHSSQEVRLRT